MKKETPTLNINDIVLLKQQPEMYLEKQLETSKTHDGTSMGKIGPVLDDWALATAKDRQVAVFDSNGKKLKQRDIRSDYVTDTRPPLLEEFMQGNQKDLHVITNKEFDSGGTAHEDKWDAGLTPFSHYTIESLFNEKNENGEYVVRSRSLVSPNGKRMTLIRNDNFGPEDEAKLKDVAQEYKQATSKYYRRYDGVEMGNRHEDRHSMEIAYEQVGSFEDFLEQEGVIKSLEDCNVKVRFSKKNYKQGDYKMEYPYP